MAGMSYDQMAQAQAQDLSNHKAMQGMPVTIDDQEDMAEYQKTGKAPSKSEERKEDKAAALAKAKKGKRK